MKYDNSSLYHVKSNIEGERRSLFDLAKWKNGLAFRKIDFSQDGVPVIKIAELNNGIGATTAYTQGNYDEDVFLQRGDLLFSWSGNPKTSIDIYRFDLPCGWLNQHIFKVTPNEDLVKKDFLYHLMKYLKPYFTEIAINKQTTGLGHVTIADLKRLNVICPAVKVQEKIVAILQTIDDKIYTNTAINKNLESQAQAIFARYFINIENTPNGWTEGSLTDIAEYLNGLAMQKFRPSNENESLPVLKIKELRQGICDAESDRCSSEIKKAYIVHDGDVIFSWSGSLLVDFWCGGDCGLNQHLFKVTSEKYDKWFYYAWTNYHLQEFIKMAADRATTMGHIKRDALEKARVLIPSQEDYNCVGKLLQPLYDAIITKRIENRKLAVLRDTLLPRLMSGEIDVGNVEV